MRLFDSRSVVLRARGSRRPAARRLALLGLTGAVAISISIAGAANADTNRKDCRRLTRQIEHFGGVAEMAADRGDDRWLDSTMAHIQRLSDRRIALCPEFEQPNHVEEMAKFFADVTKKAAKGFLKYLTFGAY